ncbi:hypothetical protein Tco_1187719 [Tanacetum coccineum]
MADSWKSMDLNKFVVKADTIDYVLHKYGSNWQVRDAIANDILDDLLKRGCSYSVILPIILVVAYVLSVAICVDGKRKDKMVIEKATSDESSDPHPFKATSDESSDHNPFQDTFDESSDHNPFQATTDESSDHNTFQATFNDTLKSSSEDTCSSDSTWEQKKLLKWYDDLSSDEQRTVYKGRRGSGFRNAAITKPEKPKSRSKHLAPTTPRTAVTTWQQILNNEFGIKRSKEGVGGSSNLRRKCKRKMM